MLSQQQVEDVMQACLEGPAVNMDLGCSIVVYGPPANGKFTLARYLSAKLGIHLVTVRAVAGKAPLPACRSSSNNANMYYVAPPDRWTSTIWRGMARCPRWCRA
jgi:hypothetical protein